MGILNVTPDSFSDGGRYGSPEQAIAAGRAMQAAGADIVDVGGESTRPGAEPVQPETERSRIVPIVRALAGTGTVSIDTRHVEVMAAALDAGARIVNDVNALRAPGAIELVANRRASVVLMHMLGDPRTMQQAPHYDNVPRDVLNFLEARIQACESAGIPRARIVVDPGIGFGKTDAHNLEILANVGIFRSTGCGVLVGVSRKGFIGRLTGVKEPERRVAGSLVLGIAAVQKGADILRVHDVADTVQALRALAALPA
jgi:dihydropteroate synthase